MNMHCATCRHLLVHRHEPLPRASRCTNAGCERTFDQSGAEIDASGGPWPTQAEMDNLEGLQGSLTKLDQHGVVVASWSYQRGTMVTVP